jgi:hypothetical protein
MFASELDLVKSEAKSPNKSPVKQFGDIEPKMPDVDPSMPVIDHRFATKTF